MTPSEKLLKKANSYEWQPIETAPKDGTLILVNNVEPCGDYTEGQPMGTASWDDYGELAWISNGCCDGISSYNPTQWMPLPDGKAGEIIRILVVGMDLLSRDLYFTMRDDVGYGDRTIPLGDIYERINETLALASEAL